jgi:hypothetical protein
MRLSRDCQTNSVYPAQQLAPVGRPRNLFSSDIPGCLFIEIANEGELRYALRGEIRMDASVLAAEMAHADDCSA